ncbi:DMT family transporter [Clostridium sp. UBA6640]|uniref:DMT family transporter n=1 Tax=Clostridium sp. UBA6640 TaxID=1946370 RepID=UPI0025C1210D|nr:DMT family transporter [Clostridium sp. UBA6640]
MKKIHGILYIVLSAIAFGIMPILAKLAYSGGASVQTTLFLRFSFATLMLFCYIKSKNISLKLEKKQYALLIFLGVAGYSLTSTMLFLSYNYISVGMATMIIHSYPAIVTFLSFVFYGEKLSLKKILCLILCILGIFIMVDLGVANYDIKGILLALIAAIGYSFYVLGASHKYIKSTNNYVITFYISLVSAISILALGLPTQTINLNIKFYSLVAILLLAFISTVIGLIAFLQGVKIIGPSNASIFGTLEPIVTLVLGILILGEGVDFKTTLGSILIIISMIILAKE